MSLQMKDRDSSTPASQMEGEMDGETQSEEELEKEQTDSQTSSLSFSSTLYAVIRIKQKYQALKKRRQGLGLVLGGPGTLAGAPVQSSPKIFTFDGLSPSSHTSSPSALHRKRKRGRKKRVLYPERSGPRAPRRQEYSLAKYSLYLLLAIVFMQVRSPSTAPVHAVVFSVSFTPTWGRPPEPGRTSRPLVVDCINTWEI